MKFLNSSNFTTPCYIIDKNLLEKNCKILESIKKQTNCKILLALKGFAAFSTFGLINKYLDGVCASSLNEARLGFEEFKKEVHTYAPAFKEEEIDNIVEYSDHIVFNSERQLNKFKNKTIRITKGVRINPEYSEVKKDIYNPCGFYSRFGIKAENLHSSILKNISGFHFHTMCEQNADVFERTLNKFESKFGKYLHDLEWVNFGGGQHFTAKGFDLKKTISLINYFQTTYNVKVYLEPGEAVVLNTGYLVTKVLDIIKNKKNVAVIDSSAAAHMPDCLEMPYKPKIINHSQNQNGKYNYIIAGISCLSGDVLGEYFFDSPLKINDKIVFDDMAHYTMVKNNTFNGINLPGIFLYHSDNNNLQLIKKFNYNDYKNRLS